MNLFRGMSQREAYVQAGYSPKQLPATLDRHAHDLAFDGKVLARLSQFQAEAKSAAIMDVTERQERLSEIARARLTDFMELGQDGSWVNLGPETPHTAAIQEIRSRTEYDDDGSKPTVYTSVRLHDPIKAIDLLNKMDKLYSDQAPIAVNNNIIFVIGRGYAEGGVGLKETNPVISLPLPESTDEKGV